jgi:hypothetical protein
MQAQLDEAVVLLETIGHAGGNHHSEPFRRVGKSGRIEAYCALGALQASGGETTMRYVISLLYSMGLNAELALFNDHISEPGEVPTLFALAAEVVREGAL